MNAELPPIGNVLVLAIDNGPREFVSRIAQEARERILQARIAELSSAAKEVIDNLPHRHDVNLDRLRSAIDAAREGK